MVSWSWRSFTMPGVSVIYVFEGDQVVLPAEAQEARRDYVQVAQFSLVSVDVEAGYVTELPIPGVQYPMPAELMLRWSGVLVPGQLFEVHGNLPSCPIPCAA